MQPRVFRGIGARRAASRLSSLTIHYAGGLAVLLALGLSVRGLPGWLLVAAPLAVVAALRLAIWRRVAVAVTDDTLRYEDAVPRRDFEVPLRELRAVGFDPALPERPLVAVLENGDERVCRELSAEASLALFRYLRERGVAAIAPDDPASTRSR